MDDLSSTSEQKSLRSSVVMQPGVFRSMKSSVAESVT